MRQLLVWGAFVMVLATPDAAGAQEAGKVGVTMGFPQSLGVLWHLSDTVAVRPELSFGFGSTELGTSESENSRLGTGVSLLVYLRKWENGAAYVSPRYALGRSTIESISDAILGGQIRRETTTRSHFVSGSFGAQQWLGTRFSVFGELGLSYQRATSETDVTVIDLSSTTTAFSTHSSIGVVLYF